LIDKYIYDFIHLLICAFLVSYQSFFINALILAKPFKIREITERNEMTVTMLLYIFLAVTPHFIANLK